MARRSDRVGSRRALQPPAFPRGSWVLDFTRPLAPQFAIEAISVRKLKQRRSWRPGSSMMEFGDVSLPRLRFLDGEAPE